MDNVTPSGRTVLVVDDNQALLNVLREALVDAGFTTTAVDHGSPAMALLAERHFDVLLVDVNLPDMNGLVLGDTARERYQDQMVILAMSGQDIEKRAVASLQVCADDFLGKPFDLDELIARIDVKLRRLPKG